MGAKLSVCGELVDLNHEYDAKMPESEKRCGQEHLEENQSSEDHHEDCQAGKTDSLPTTARQYAECSMESMGIPGTPLTGASLPKIPVLDLELLLSKVSSLTSNSPSLTHLTTTTNTTTPKGDTSYTEYTDVSYSTSSDSPVSAPSGAGAVYRGNIERNVNSKGKGKGCVYDHAASIARDMATRHELEDHVRTSGNTSSESVVTVTNTGDTTIATADVSPPLPLPLPPSLTLPLPFQILPGVPEKEESNTLTKVSAPAPSPSTTYSPVSRNVQSSPPFAAAAAAVATASLNDAMQAVAAGALMTHINIAPSKDDCCPNQTEKQKLQQAFGEWKQQAIAANSNSRLNISEIVDDKSQIQNMDISQGNLLSTLQSPNVKVRQVVPSLHVHAITRPHHHQQKQQKIRTNTNTNTNTYPLFIPRTHSHLRLDTHSSLDENENFPDDISEGNASIPESQASTVNLQLGSPFSDNTSLVSYSESDTPYHPVSVVQGGVHEIWRTSVAAHNGGITPPYLSVPGMQKGIDDIWRNVAPNKDNQSSPILAYSNSHGRSVGGIKVNVNVNSDVTPSMEDTTFMAMLRKSREKMEIEMNMTKCTKDDEVEAAGESDSFANSSEYSSVTAGSKEVSNLDSYGVAQLRVLPGKKMTVVRRIKKAGAAALRAAHILNPKEKGKQLSSSSSSSSSYSHIDVINRTSSSQSSLTLARS